MTNQRREILRVIRESDEHLTAEQIYQEAKKTLPNLAVGTVYRNLGKMTEEGEIKCIVIPGKPNHYDKTTIEHDHFECLECGKLYDIIGLNLMEEIKGKLEMKVMGHQLNVYGLCKACASARRDMV